jgi:hypothetical protein
MKTRYAKLLKALPLLFAVTLSACGNDNADQNGGVPIGVATGGITTGVNGPQADGSIVVSFTGSGQATSSYRILAGQFPVTTGNCGNDGSFACFRNRIGGQTVQELGILGRSWGALSLGTVAAYGTSYQKPERFYYPRDGRTSISFSLGGGGSGSAVPVSGVITLSPQFVATELGNQQIIAVGLDLSAASGQWGGQAFLLTGPNNGSFIVF